MALHLSHHCHLWNREIQGEIQEVEHLRMLWQSVIVEKASFPVQPETIVWFPLQQKDSKTSFADEFVTKLN